MSRRIQLLDANVVIALTVREHASHLRAFDWFTSVDRLFATCPITQGALVRYICRQLGGSGAIVGAKKTLRGLVENRSHVFWPNDVSYLALPERGLRGHKQVTDFYLVALAGKNGGKLATMDESLAALFPDVCELI